MYSGNWQYLDTLAAAYAAAGDFAEAVRIQQLALAAADDAESLPADASAAQAPPAGAESGEQASRAVPDAAAHDALRTRLDSYRSGEAYVEPLAGS
ncbi:MAG: hypothetical protein R3E86_01990 [Pseudomonadales bacterium]